MNDPTIEEILEWPECEDIKAELNDPRYATRQHYSRATYAKGCDGPLCRKRERDRGRVRNERDGGEGYRPSANRKYDRDALMDAIVAWHMMKRAEHRAIELREAAS